MVGAGAEVGLRQTALGPFAKGGIEAGAGVALGLGVGLMVNVPAGVAIGAGLLGVGLVNLATGAIMRWGTAPAADPAAKGMGRIENISPLGALNVQVAAALPPHLRVMGGRMGRVAYVR